MKQKAGDEWEFFSDRCSKFFHKFLKAKKNKSTITEILDKGSNEVTGQNEIARVFR